MELVEIVVAIFRSRRFGLLLGVSAVLFGILVVAYMLHAFTATQTHVGFPSPVTLAANSVLPAIGAVPLILIYRGLPKQLVRAAQFLAVGSRRHVLWAGALGLVAGTALWARMCPEVTVLRVLPVIVGVLSSVLLAALILHRAEETTPPGRASDAAPDGNDSKLVPVWAKTLRNSIVAGSGVSMALLILAVMSRLPVGAGGLREKCVQLDVLTVGMPAPARAALVGEAAAKHESPGREMTLPARILRRDKRDAFLWMGTGRGVTVPLERIGVIVDYDEGTIGCVGDGA